MGLRGEAVQKVVMILALGLSGCVSTDPGSKEALRRIVGTDLIGVQGKTSEDQRRINRTVVGLCGPDIYTPAECKRHGEAVKEDD